MVGNSRCRAAVPPAFRRRGVTLACLKRASRLGQTSRVVRSQEAPLGSELSWAQDVGACRAFAMTCWRQAVVIRTLVAQR